MTTIRSARARTIPVPSPPTHSMSWKLTRNARYKDMFPATRNPSEILKDRADILGVEWRDVLALAGASKDEISAVESGSEWLLPASVLINALIILQIDHWDFLTAAGYLPMGWNMEKHRKLMREYCVEYNDAVSGLRNDIQEDLRRRLEAADRPLDWKPPMTTRQLAEAVYG